MNFYGIKGIEIIPHGQWADPELKYKGKLYSYILVEDYMWENYEEHCKYFNIEKTEEDFELFVYENKDTVIDLLESIEGEEC